MREYFKWLVSKVDDPKGVRSSKYQLLLQSLYLTKFYAINGSDQNRAIDGVIMRRKYEEETGEINSEAAGHLDGDCSMLEMMVSLAIKIETEYLADHRKGDQTYIWFWTMIDSLGLMSADNKHFEEKDFDEKMTRFLTKSGNFREGKGGLTLFPNDSPGKHMEERPIWDQMLDWINRKFL